MEYKDGKPNGWFTLYKNLDTLGYVWLSDGRKEGLQVYKPLGNSGHCIRQVFKNGKAEGALIITENDKVFYFCNYKNNLKDGAEYEFFDSGQLRWSLANVKGKTKDGVYYCYDVDGAIDLEWHFKDGFLIKTIHYDNDVKNIK